MWICCQSLSIASSSMASSMDKPSDIKVQSLKDKFQDKVRYPRWKARVSAVDRKFVQAVSKEGMIFRKVFLAEIW